MNAEELRQRYSAGERDFSGIDIRNAELNNICLSQANLLGAKIIDCHLNYANLSEANLCNADLSGSSLCAANLIEANLRNALLRQTDLNYADLLGADLTGANITEAFNVSSPHLLIVDEDKNSHPELVQAIREVSRGLHNRHNSEGSAPYDVFLWDVASRGNFTLDKFLEAIGLLVEIQLFDLLEYKFPIEEYSILLQQLRPYLSNHKYYFLKAGLEWLDNYALPLLIGNTLNGDWIGMCPTVDIERGGSEFVGRIQDSASRKSDHRELVSILEKIAAEVNFSKRWDYALESTWEIAETREALLHNILMSSNMMIFFQDLEAGFFGEDDDEDRKKYYPEIYKKIQTLSDLVRANLKNIRVYWLSDGKVHVYIVGQTEDGDWIGIHNRLIQT